MAIFMFQIPESGIFPICRLFNLERYLKNLLARGPRGRGTLGRLCYTYPCVIQLDVLVLIFFNMSHLNIQFSPKNSSVPPYYRPIPFYSSIYFKKSSLRTFSYYSFNLEVPKPL